MRSLASSSGATNASQVGAAATACAIATRPSSRSASTAGATCSGFNCAKRGSPEKSRRGFISSGSQTVFEKHGDRHRSDPARNQADPAGDIFDRREIHIAGERTVGQAVVADIVYAVAWLHHLSRHEGGPAEGGDE